MNPDDRLVAYLEQKRGRRSAVRVALPGDPKKDYLGSGAHPDIVERLWKRLNTWLPVDCRRLLWWTPVLMHPESEGLLAVALGTRYIVRIPSDTLEKDLPEDARQVMKWSGGTITDVRAEFGDHWVPGNFRPVEIEWCAEVFNEYSK